MNAFILELFQARLYKRSQGRITRQVTWAAMAVGLFAICWRMSSLMSEMGTALSLGVPALVFAAGLWVAFRAVNVPVFADFLVAVEAEMNKVSWPTKTELIRGSAVVLVMIFTLAVVIFAFDIVWVEFFQFLRIL
jgi:preprotein translocase subunit SecE